MWFVFALLSAIFAALTSILAKVERDRYMKAMALKYRQYAFEKHKGYGGLKLQGKMKPDRRGVPCKLSGNQEGVSQTAGQYFLSFKADSVFSIACCVLSPPRATI